MKMSALRNTVLSATLALGTAFGSTATPAAAEQDNIHLASINAYETVDRDTAKARSAGGIVLHVGAGFPDRPVRVLTDMLTEQGFRVEALGGGTDGKITLCLNNQCWNEDFDVANSAQVLHLVEAYGKSLLASGSKAPQPDRS